MTVNIESHSTHNKRFDIDMKHVSMAVDYDDVNHMEVDAAVLHLKEIIEKHWNEDVYEGYYHMRVLNAWNENKYNLQSDYESKEEYLENYGITVQRMGE